MPWLRSFWWLCSATVWGSWCPDTPSPTVVDTGSVPGPDADEETAELARALGHSDGPTELVFPSPNGKTMGSGSLIKLLHDNGYHDATVRGIRSTFMDWAGSRDVKLRVAKAALAHEKDDSYYRTRHFDERVYLMREWAVHIGI